MQIITRAEAKEKGLKRYFTGKPCKHGHISERNVGEGKCVKCIAEQRKKKYEENKQEILIKKKEYYSKNKEKISKKNKILYCDNRDKFSDKNRKYRINNRDKLNRYAKIYRDTNREKIVLIKKEFYEENREKILNQKKEYHENNKVEICEKKRSKYNNNIKEARRKQNKYWNSPKGKAIRRNANYLRRTIKKQGDVSTKQLLTLQQTQTHCYWCGTPLKNKVSHVDHYIPLSKGGKHTISNLVMACASCNLSKGAKMPEEFALQVGRLL